MFSLDLPTEPYWLDLPHGVRVKVRPLTSTVMAATRAALQRQLAHIEAQRADIIAANMPADDLPDLSDPDVKSGIVSGLHSAALGRFAIIEWTGVEQPYSPAMAERMMGHDDMAMKFLELYFAPIMRLDAEGNGSSPAPNGSPPAALTIAGDAPSGAGTAPPI